MFFQKVNKMNAKYDFNKVINNFRICDGELTYCERYGEGHINETYLAVISNGGK